MREVNTKVWYVLKKEVRNVTEQVIPAQPDGYEAKFDENKDEKKKKRNTTFAAPGPGHITSARSYCQNCQSTFRSDEATWEGKLAEAWSENVLV